MACESIVLSFNTCQVWSTLQCTACLHAPSRHWTRVDGCYLCSRQQDSQVGALPDLEGQVEAERAQAKVLKTVVQLHGRNGSQPSTSLMYKHCRPPLAASRRVADLLKVYVRGVDCLIVGQQAQTPA